MREIEHRSEDFISIDSIKNIFLDFFRFLFRIADFIILSIRRKLALFLFCCVLGIISGYLYYWQNPKYYETEMIVQSNSLSKKAYHEIVENLNALIGSQSYFTLSTQLKVNEQAVRDVVSIEAVAITNTPLNLDTSTRVNEPFKIQLKAGNTESIPALQNALLNYFKNSPYLRLVKDGEKKIYAEKLDFITRQQKKLDSLISNYQSVTGEVKMPSTFYNNTVDPATLYQHSLKLDSAKEKTQKWLNSESEPVFLIDGFKAPANPQSASLILSLALGLSVGILIGVLLVLLSGLRRAVK